MKKVRTKLCLLPQISGVEVAPCLLAKNSGVEVTPSVTSVESSEQFGVFANPDVLAHKLFQLAPKTLFD